MRLTTIERRLAELERSLEPDHRLEQARLQRTLGAMFCSELGLLEAAVEASEEGEAQHLLELGERRADAGVTRAEIERRSRFQGPWSRTTRQVGTYVGYHADPIDADRWVIGSDYHVTAHGAPATLTTAEVEALCPYDSDDRRCRCGWPVPC